MSDYGTGGYGVGLYGSGVPPPYVESTLPPVPVHDYTVLVTDRDLNVAGDPIYCWTSLDITLRFNEPGSGILIVPAYPWVRDQFTPGARVVVIRDGKILVSGPMEGRLHERADDEDNSGVGKLTVNFADDLAPVVARLVHPDPDLAVAAQVSDAWTYTGNAEVALRTLVNVQAGPTAPTGRRIPHLALGGLAGVGSAVTVTAQRMQPLGEVAREIAQIGGGLGFRAVQSGGQILFEVYAPVDRSNTVRFSFGIGNLRYISHEMTAPTATSVIVGGQGDGADRAMIERTNTVDETAWGRYEKLVSRPGSDPLQDLQDDGDRELGDGAATTRVASNVADTFDQQFGYHYNLGDIVALEPWDGEQIVDLIRVVHLQAFATTGEYVAATIGNQAAVTDPVWVKRVREIDERIGRLERRVLPAVS